MAETSFGTTWNRALLATAALAFMVGCSPEATPKPTPVDAQEREDARIEKRRQRELKLERNPTPRDPNRVVPVVKGTKATPCSADSECGEGERCSFSACQGTGLCAEAGECGTEVTYCDCEGEDFTAPLGCPGKPYDHRGSCEGPGPNYRK